MPETGENVARDCESRTRGPGCICVAQPDADSRALKEGFFAEEIVPVEVADKTRHRTRVERRASTA